MIRAKPCPFCGEGPDIDNPAQFDSYAGGKWAAVVCGCGARGPDVRTGYKLWEYWRDDAVAAWNERPTGTIWQHKIQPAQTWHAIPFQIRKDIGAMLSALDDDPDLDWAIYNRVSEWLTAEERPATPTPAADNPPLPTIVCLCGSTRFYTTYQEHYFQETMQGKIVLSVGFYPHATPQMHGGMVYVTAAEKAMLDELHLRKIDLADEVLFLNVKGYLGESSLRELDYARSKGKTVRFLEPFFEGTVAAPQDTVALPTDPSAQT